MKTIVFWILCPLILLTAPIFNDISAQSQNVQDDPLEIIHTNITPEINGIGDDFCWQAATWQSIGKVWIPFNGSVLEDDYTGRYKVMYSKETNLLYFLIEVYDDVLVDGYVSSQYGGCYNYDITEVFIDENRSGGEHRYDGSNSNAENAFAYHMYASYPDEGEVNDSPYIEDMIGNQANSKWVDQASHFPEFALRRTGNNTVREFSLIVYDDTYTEDNKDSARVKLEAGKIMGLSLAYCDNDHPERNPKTRDNMYGSVVEPNPGNLHWMNADHFGNAILTDDLNTENNDSKIIPVQFKLYQNYPNPFNPNTVIRFEIPEFSYVSLKIYDVLGKEVSVLVDEEKDVGNYIVNFDGTDMTSGIYFSVLKVGKHSASNKMLLLK